MNLPKTTGKETKKEKKYCLLKNQFKNRKTYQFVSNSPKAYVAPNQMLTANVDFSGQSTFTIQEKLAKKLEQINFCEPEDEKLQR